MMVVIRLQSRNQKDVQHLQQLLKMEKMAKTPKVKAERDEAKKQTTLTFYIDKDGDGNYTEGTDTLVQNIHRQRRTRW